MSSNEMLARPATLRFQAGAGPSANDVEVLNLVLQRLLISPLEAERIATTVLEARPAEVPVPSVEIGWAITEDLRQHASSIVAWVERGRLAQWTDFEVQELHGELVEQLLGLFAEDDCEQLILLYLKTRSPAWHRFFLDAGVACWEDWGVFDDEGCCVRDLGAEWGLIGSVIMDARTVGGVTDAGVTLTIRFESGAEVRLAHADPRDIESEVRVSLARSREGEACRKEVLEAVLNDRDIPSWTKEAIRRWEAGWMPGTPVRVFVKSHTLDISYIDFLDEQIRLGARGEEWTRILRARKAALVPHVGRNLVNVIVNHDRRRIRIELTRLALKAVYWEES